MDVAYDHVQEEALAPSEEGQRRSTAEASASHNLPNDLQDAFKAVSNSPWGTTLGGWLSQARKKGESLVADLQKEAQDVQSEASQGWSRLRTMSLNAHPGPETEIPGQEAVPTITKTPAEEKAEDKAEDKSAETSERPESLPADIVKEAGSLVASLRSTAASKLKDLQRAEDAADEALLKFGANVRNFLRDAVTITAPTDADRSKPRGTDGVGNEVLFETSEPGTGKKVFHTTRLDAQLHAIHTTASSFTEDPQGPEWEAWKDGGFDIDMQTDAIAQDLGKYEELRRAMEKLVPEKVEYQVFWMRYYFLRKALDEEEKRRREVLKGELQHPSLHDAPSLTVPRCLSRPRRRNWLGRRRSRGRPIIHP
jgi:hypothetical protein